MPFYKLCSNALIIIVIFICCQPAIAEDNSRFMALFSYEVQNRAFALLSVSGSEETRKDEIDGPFWAAYHRFEILNQHRYAAHADQYQIDMSPTTMTKTKNCLAGFIGSLFFETGLGIMRDATIPYIEKLKELKDLAKAEDKDFFNYVVMQEEIQAETLTLLIDNKHEEAVGVFNEFIKQQTMEPAASTKPALSWGSDKLLSAMNSQ